MSWGDEIAAAADTLISKIPGVRSAAEYLAPVAGGRGGSLSYTDPNVTYQQRRDAYRATNAAAKEAHPYAYGGGELAGGIATAFAPGMTLAKGAGALKVGAQGAALGGAAAAGESEAKDVKGVLKDTAEGAAIGGVGGAVLHKAAGKAAKILAKGLPELADRQATRQLLKKAPDSLTEAVSRDANLSAAINAPLPGAGGKPVTLAQIAGKPAAEVKPVVEAGQQKIGQALESHFHTADAASGGGGKLADLAQYIDSEIAQRGSDPNNAEHIAALKKTQADAIKSWGPSEEARQSRLDEIGRQTEEMYDRSDKKTGGVAVGDLVKHYDDQIAKLSKSPHPGDQAAAKALQHARDTVAGTWGKARVFNPEMIVDGGPFGGAKAGDAVAKLEKMAQARPAAAADLNAEAQRIRDAATAEGFDPTAKVPAREVRRFATGLQKEAVTGAEDPKAAAAARQFLGATTKDFVNGHVEKSLGKADRKALESLNQRTRSILSWDDVLAGKASPDVRNAVLNEFDTRVPTAKLDEYAQELAERGRQHIAKLSPGPAAQARENLGTSARDFLAKHLGANLSPEDAAAAEKLAAHRESLNNIHKVLERRELGESKARMSGKELAVHGASGLAALEQVAHAVPHALAGDFGTAAKHIAGAATMVGAPFAVKNAGAAGRALIRGAARGTDYLAQAVAQADAGNPAAQRILALLRSTPAGAARLAAAIARMKGTAAPPPTEP